VPCQNLHTYMNIDDSPLPLRGIFKTSQFWLAVFVVLLLVISGIFLGAYKKLFPYKNLTEWSSGGPVENSSDEYPTGTTLDLGSLSSIPRYFIFQEEGEPSFIYTNEALAVGISYPYSNVIPIRHGLKKYKVRKGDTLSGIAAQFGVTLETMKYANLDFGSVISPGDELIILPVSGILYKVETGDTLETVAAKYRINPELVRKYNPEYQKLFDSDGQMAILPYAKPLNKWSYTRLYSKNLPNLDSYFALPARGWNWGELHYYNAVDIAADCGTPIFASAEGIIEEESGDNRWNNGYGNYILIKHQNGTETEYAHTLKNFVSEGDYVLQGEEIAFIGNTGNADGPTGCHLHFEVHGAQNPFAMK